MYATGKIRSFSTKGHAHTYPSAPIPLPLSLVVGLGVGSASGPLTSDVARRFVDGRRGCRRGWSILRCRRWMGQRRIEQIAQVVLQLQVGSISPWNVLDGQVSRQGAESHRARFILQVELADAVHQGFVLALPAFLQKRLGRDVVEIICSRY